MTLQIRSRGTAAQQARYRLEIEGVLGQIRPTRTGTIVLEHIERSPHRVTIVPYTDGDRNAEAVPGNWRASGTVGRGRPAAGTGSRVRFSLRMSTMPPNWPQGNPGEVLVHELAHALRQVTGTERYRAGGSGDFLTPLPPSRSGHLGPLPGCFPAIRGNGTSPSRIRSLRDPSCQRRLLRSLP